MLDIAKLEEMQTQILRKLETAADKKQLKDAILQIDKLIILEAPDEKISSLINFSKIPEQGPLICQMVKEYLHANFVANFCKIEIEKHDWDEHLLLIKNIMSRKTKEGKLFADIDGTDQRGNNVAKMIVNFFSVYSFAKKIKYKDEKTLQLDEDYKGLLEKTMQLLNALGIEYEQEYFGLLAETVPFSYYTADLTEQEQKRLALFLEPQNYSKAYEDTLTFGNLKEFLEGKKTDLLIKLSEDEEHLPPIASAISTAISGKYIGELANHLRSSILLRADLPDSQKKLYLGRAEEHVMSDVLNAIDPQAEAYKIRYHKLAKLSNKNQEGAHLIRDSQKGNVSKDITTLAYDELALPKTLAIKDLYKLAYEARKLNPNFLWNALRNSECARIKENKSYFTQIKKIIFMEYGDKRNKAFEDLFAIHANRIVFSCVTVLKYLMYLSDGFDLTELLNLINAYNFNELIEAIYRGEKYTVERITKREIINLDTNFEYLKLREALEDAMKKDDKRERTPASNDTSYQETKPSKLREFFKLFSETNYLEIARKNMTALFYAVYLGRTDIVEVLKNAGANLEPENEYGFTPLHLAAFKGDILMMYCLIKLGADPEKTDRDGRTILHFAAEGSSAEVIRKFSENKKAKDKLNINAQDNLGQTPLHISCKKDAAIVKVLLYAGAQDISDKNGCLPQHIAAMHKNIEAVKHIAIRNFECNYLDTTIRFSDNPKEAFHLNLADNEGKNILHHLVISNTTISFIPYMVMIMNDVGARKYTGYHYNSDLRQALFQAFEAATNEAANARDNARNTPLHYAAEAENNETVQNLINMGAKSLLNKDGRNPADLARLKGYEDTVAILEKAGIKSSLPAPRWIDKIYGYGSSLKFLAGRLERLWPATPPATDIKRKEEEQPLLHREHEKQD